MPRALLLLPPLNNEAIRRLAVTGLVALRRLPPRCYGMPAATGLAFATAQGVVDWIHRHAAHVRPLAEPAAAARLAVCDVLVIDVANLTDRRDTLDVDLANLARRHLDRGIVAFARHELHPRAGAARNLSALAR